MSLLVPSVLIQELDGYRDLIDSAFRGRAEIFIHKRYITPNGRFSNRFSNVEGALGSTIPFSAHMPAKATDYFRQPQRLYQLIPRIMRACPGLKYLVVHLNSVDRGFCRETLVGLNKFIHSNYPHLKLCVENQHARTSVIHRPSDLRIIHDLANIGFVCDITHIPYDSRGHEFYNRRILDFIEKVKDRADYFHISGVRMENGAVKGHFELSRDSPVDWLPVVQKIRKTGKPVVLEIHELSSGNRTSALVNAKRFLESLA
jgi:hypothetical protein